jgi:hypothetical protein
MKAIFFWLVGVGAGLLVIYWMAYSSSHQTTANTAHTAHTASESLQIMNDYLRAHAAGTPADTSTLMTDEQRDKVRASNSARGLKHMDELLQGNTASNYSPPTPTPTPTPFVEQLVSWAFLALFALICLLSKFLPQISFRKPPKPGTDLHTIEARVLRTIRSRSPFMVLGRTYADLENQPCFANRGYKQIVHKAYTELRGDCEDKSVEVVTLIRSLKTIDWILEAETQRIKPIVEGYREAAKSKGETPLEVVDIHR